LLTGLRPGLLAQAPAALVLAYMDFPKEHWAQISSTNPLERVNTEIKRRSDLVGIFPNDDAIIVRRAYGAARAWRGPRRPRLARPRL